MNAKALKVLNGFSVIAQEHVPGKGYVILAARLDDSGFEYVTALMGNVDLDREWFWGHYFRSLTEATTDYQKRIDFQ